MAAFLSMSRIDHLHTDLTTSWRRISGGDEPILWFNACKAYAWDHLGEDKIYFPRIQVHLFLTVYTYMHVKFCSTSPRDLDALRAQLSEWGRLNDLAQLIIYPSISHVLLGFLGNCAAKGHQCNTSAYTRKLMYQDLITAAVLLAAMIRNPEWKNSLLSLDESKAKSLLNLMHEIMVSTDLDDEIRSTIYQAAIRISQKPKDFPGCLIQRYVTFPRTPTASGRLGDIWRCEAEGRGIAIKVLGAFTEAESQALVKIYASQVVLWGRLRHPNILPFYGVHLWKLDPSRVCLISPWMDNGNIVHFLNTFPNTARLPLLYDVALGLEYLHTRTPRIVHSDLKGSNILITSYQRACIANFNLSVFSQDSRLLLQRTQSGRGVGSLSFMAPEILASESAADDSYSRLNTPACDIYSYGCVCYEAFAGNAPFSGAEKGYDIIKAVVDGRRPSRPHSAFGLDGEIWNLITLCWHQYAKERPSVHEVLEILSRKMTVPFRRAPDWDNFRMRCSCAPYDDDEGRYGEAQPNEQVISQSSSDNLLSKTSPFLGVTSRISALSVNPKSSKTRTQHKPDLVTSKRLKSNTTIALDDEALEAAFVVCWPKVAKTTSSLPITKSKWDGDCVLWLHDSYQADAWINANYDHRCVDSLRQHNVGGPIASMLSPESPALSIFGSTSLSLVKMARDLANFSGFPVVIRPPNEDPSDRFGNGRVSSLRCATASQGSSGNETPAQTNRSVSSAQSSSQGSKMGIPTDERNNRGTDRNDSEEEDARPPPLPSLPPPPPLDVLPRKEIIHQTDISLGILIDGDDKKDFLNVITGVKFYPVPNSKEQPGENQPRVNFEPKIESHVYLEVRRSPSVTIDNAVGSLGFWTEDTDYFRTEHFLQPGHDKLLNKVNRVKSIQVSKAAHLSGGVAGASVGYSQSKLNTYAIEATGDAVAKTWTVSPQFKRKDSPNYRSLDVMILREETQADDQDIIAEYGMTVGINVKKAPQVSFVYRHQISCWVPVESKAKTRGIIILTAHCIPDIRTEDELWIYESPLLNLVYKNTASESQDGDATGQARTSDGVFAFSTAVVPGVTSRKRKDRGILNAWRRARKLEAQAIPVYNHVFRGWDHSNKKWLEPIWPKLGGNLAGTKEKPHWLMAWLDESSETAMVETGAESADGGSTALNEKESKKINKGKAKEVVW